MSLIKRKNEGSGHTYERSFFLHCDGPRSDLELVSMDEGAEEADGVVSLMDCNGAEFKAECLEVVLYRPRIRTGCSYLWTTYLAAERFSPLEKEICITSGPTFEMHKEEYRQEWAAESEALLMRQLKIDELYAFNKSEFVGELCRSTGLQSRLEAPLFRD